MTIRYFTTRGDLLYANCRAVTRNKVLWSAWFLIIIWLCYEALQEPKLAQQGVGYKAGFCLILAGLYFGAFFTATLVLTSALVLTRKHKGVLGEHRLSVSDEGLLESTVHNESLHRWSVYHRTISTGSYLLLYVTDAQYHIVSKRRPLLEGDIVGFEAALRAKTASGERLT